MVVSLGGKVLRNAMVTPGVVREGKPRKERKERKEREERKRENKKKHTWERGGTERIYARELEKKKRNTAVNEVGTPSYLLPSV